MATDTLRSHRFQAMNHGPSGIRYSSDAKIKRLVVNDNDPFRTFFPEISFIGSFFSRRTFRTVKSRVSMKGEFVNESRTLRISIMLCSRWPVRDSVSYVFPVAFALVYGR